MEAWEKLNLIIENLEKAGDKILEIYHKKYEIKTKSDNTKVTEADLASNEIIVDFLQKEFTYQIISEENKNQKLTQAHTWTLDPIDGTSDFINKTGDFSIMLALLHKKEVVFSIIYIPLEKTFYYAIKNQGAYKLDKNNTSPTPALLKVKNQPGEITMHVSRSHVREIETKISKKVGITKFIRSGSIGIKMARISEGKGNLYINSSSKLGIWDLAPPALILLEAGGCLQDLNGKKVNYEGVNFKIENGCIAANDKKLLKEIVDIYKVYI